MGEDPRWWRFRSGSQPLPTLHRKVRGGAVFSGGKRCKSLGDKGRSFLGGAPRGAAQVERCVYLGKWLVASGWTSWTSWTSRTSRTRAEEVSGKEGGGSRVPSGNRGRRMDRLARSRKRIRRPLTRNTRRAQTGGLASPPTASKPTLTRHRRDRAYPIQTHCHEAYHLSLRVPHRLRRGFDIESYANCHCEERVPE